MKFKRLLWLFLVLIIGCSQQTKQPPLKYNQRIVAFGDSLTFGFGAQYENSYPVQLDKMIPQSVINAGISGEETRGSLQRIDSVLSKYHPALVLLCIGGNDFLRKRPKAITEKNIGLLIDKIHQSGSRVVLIAVPELGLFLSPSEIYSRVAESHQVLLINDVLTDLISDPKLKSDAIHLNAKGYKLFAEQIYQNLIDFGIIN